MAMLQALVAMARYSLRQQAEVQMALHRASLAVPHEQQAGALDHLRDIGSIDCAFQFHSYAARK